MKAGQSISRWSLTEKLRDFSEQKVVLSDTPWTDSGSVELAVSFVKWPRDGMRYYWHLVPIYEQLELALCSSQPSKWAYQQSNAQPLSYLKDEVKCKQVIIKSNNNLKQAVAMKTTESFLRDLICVFV